MDGEGGIGEGLLQSLGHCQLKVSLKSTNIKDVESLTMSFRFGDNNIWFTNGR